MGMTIGASIGDTGLVFNFKEGGNHPLKDYATDSALGAFTGIVAGVVVGFIVGWNNIYQFNP